MFRIFLLAFLFVGSIAVQAQSPGDTIRVQAFNFDSDSRDTMISFPTDDNLTFEKILLNYTMRCKDGLVSTGANSNLGCGEWDFSCNTYLADSTKPESVLTEIPSHFISNYDESVFPFLPTPVYDYMRGTQVDVEILSANNEVAATIENGLDALSRTLITDKSAGKSQYLYTAAELSAAGLAAGEVHGMNLKILDNAGAANFLKIKMQNSSKTELDGFIETDGFTEVYYLNTTLNANSDNRFQFHTPFVWDGSSSILMEFNFTNVDATFSNTEIEGETIASKMGLSSTNEQEIMLTNNAYIECDDYAGVEGNGNRTVEAWIKTTDGSNGEIIGWGAIVTGRKWVFRVANGVLRLEVHGGGTESATRIDDGQWHHVACVLEGNDLTDISFYVDGVLDGISVASNTAVNSSVTGTKVRISRGLSNRYIDASVDEVRIWDTALTEETINEWKGLKVDEDHPNYDNLQLYYQFDGSGNAIIDSSPNGRDGTLIGERFSISAVSGAELFKDFQLENNRPNVVFYQGDYATNVTSTEVDRPIAKPVRHLAIERTIEPTDPNFALDDNIIIDGPQELWLPEENIFDEATGNLIETNSLTPLGEIDIVNLEYQRRFPFYNELVSFVTPYGIGLDFGEGASWVIDMSDYVSILKGDKRILMTLGGQRQEDMDLEFLFIVGTPPRDVVQYEQIWQGTNRIGIARIDQIIEDEKFAPFDIDLSSDAETFKLKSSITGHGSEGEFQANGGLVNHLVRVDQSDLFAWSVHKECSFNPIFPQGGTWVYDRQGWCPGEQSTITENDLTPHVTPGGSVNLDYYTTAPSISTGDYRYHVAHQLVGYGDPNFQNDAAVVNVMAPNNGAEYIRVGNVCSNPIVVIQNTGAETLTSLTINYWLNDSQAPQTFEWSGSLDFMEMEEVHIPNKVSLWYDILTEDNEFHVEISAPNGDADGYEYNNTFTSTFDFPDILPSNLTVEVRSNFSAFENTYQLLDSDGNVVGSNDLPIANNTYLDDYNLSDGCYKLIITDSGGDGLQWWANPNQGSGFARIRNTDGDIIETLESDFGGRIEYNFSTTFPVAVEDLNFLKSIEVFPNPADNYFTLKADDLSESNVYIINSVGQRVVASVISRGNEEIMFGVDGLDFGVYFIVIERADVVTTRRVVLK